MLNKLHGQPDSYDRKLATTPRELEAPYRTECSDRRSRYRFGRTLGAGTYGIVREADCPEGKVAVKIILKKNVRGNEQMVYDELEMLQRMRHPHIVKFHDWFESRVGAAAYALLCHELNRAGQILHCNPIGNRRRVVRPHLRQGQVHGEGCC
jgi:hypothetical protein